MESKDKIEKYPEDLNINETFKLFDAKKINSDNISVLSQQISEDSEVNQKNDLNKVDFHTKDIENLINKNKNFLNLEKNKYNKYNKKEKKIESDSDTNNSNSSFSDLSDNDSLSDGIELKKKKYSKNFGSEELEFKRQIIIQINRFKKTNNNIQNVNLKNSVEELQLILDGLIDSESYNRKRRFFRIFIKSIAYIFETIITKTGYFNGLKDWHHNVNQNIDNYNPYFDEMIKPEYRTSKKTGELKIVKKTNIITVMSSNTLGGLFCQLTASAFLYSFSNNLYDNNDNEDDDDDDEDDDNYFNEEFQKE
jgi:hypothetical protein